MPLHLRTISQALKITCLSSCLSACVILGPNQINVGPTLSNLPEMPLPDDISPAPVESAEEIERSYRAALEVAESPEIRHRILVRLADLEMATSEDQQLSALEEQEHFSDAISMYDELLQLNETQADQVSDERLLYRLSKAYAMDGKMEESDKVLARLVKLHPQSPYAAEVEFRRAEHAFSEGLYVAARNFYAKVIAAGPSTPFYTNALYMHGWSLFKANEFEQSIDSFTQVLDLLLLEQDGAEPVKGGQSLIDDTFRVMAITFTYLDGAQSITDSFQRLGQRPYQYRLYQQLGELHLEKERYQDAANTYRHFIDTFPTSDYGPEFSVRMLDVFKKGGFPEQILPAKEHYVQNYGLGSQFWQTRSEEQKQALIPYLESFLEELSSYYHAEGQALKEANAKYLAEANRGKQPKVKPKTAEPNFLRAADYYDQFISLFPESEKLGEMSFLKAEAYYEAGETLKAINAYEVVAYKLLDPKYGATSGYAAILALTELLAKGPEPEQFNQLRTRKIDNALNFADYYPTDPNAIVVLTQTAQEVFKSGDQEQAVQIAQRITQWQPQPEAKLRKTAWLILAHSQFDQQNFTQSEASYREVLALLPENAAEGGQSAERAEIVERIAASMYKAAELKLAAGEVDAAIAQFLDIENIAPSSDIAMKAQYGAGNQLMELKQWQRAEQVFRDFEKRYPNDPLSQTLLPKFVVIYQSLEQWDRAAAELALMSKAAKTPEERRQALYLSAELYQKSGQLKNASAQYSEYVKLYPSPFNLATEARYQLLQIAEQRGDRKAYRDALKVLINADKKAGKNRSDRSRYLAAFGSNYFANESFSRFEKIKLTMPLKKSLKRKRVAMKEAIDAYKDVLNYGVAEFATEANFKIGDVYAQLSRDLLDSERPSGLDDLALEQYEILLEEQAYPLEEKSVDLLEANAQRSWDGFYDQWVQQSIDALAKILPARYGKKEARREVSRGLH